jgi:ADP-heptose:LPS heptosyltransferase
MISSEIKNILIIKWGALGDTIMGTSAIRAVRENFPEAKITILSNELMKQILPQGFLNDELLVIKSKESFNDQLKMIFQLRKRKFDLAINLRWTSERAAFFAFLSGAKIRVGSGPKRVTNLYTIKATSPVGRYHELHRNLDIVKTLGLKINDENPVVYISDSEQEFANSFFRKNLLEKKNTICIHPGASKPIRAWPPERFRQIAKLCSNELKVKVIVTRGEIENELAHFVADGLGDNVIVCNKTKSIGELAAIIKNSGLFFSNCTGPMNVAVAVRTPVVALLGSSDPVDWGAYGDLHINIKSPLVLDHYTDEDEQRAMQMITVENVWEEIKYRWNQLYS